MKVIFLNIIKRLELKLNGLYAIIGPSHSHDPINDVKTMCTHGVRLFQWRDKSNDKHRMIDKCLQLKQEVINEFQGKLFVNDHIDVALESGCDGVHLGQSDLSVMDAKKHAGDRLMIGLTVSKRQHITEMDSNHLDYVSVGGVFATQSKKNAPEPIGIVGLQQHIKHIKYIDDQLPIFCISGINRYNITQVLDCGVDGVAMAQALHEDIDVITKAYQDYCSEHINKK